MMKRFLLIAIAVTVLGGCAHMQKPTKTRQGNTIISTGYPKAKIKIDSDFAYAGKSSKYVDVTTESQTTTRSNIDSTKFVFGETYIGRTSAFAVVRFMKMQKSGWQFLRESEWVNPGVVYSKVSTAIGEMEAYSGITQAKGFVNWAAPGVSFPGSDGCIAATIMRQIPQAMARYKFQVVYGEFIPCDNMNQFYYGDGTPTATAKRRLERVRDNALKDVLIISTEN